MSIIMFQKIIEIYLTFQIGFPKRNCTNIHMFTGCAVCCLLCAYSETWNWVMQSHSNDKMDRNHSRHVFWIGKKCTKKKQTQKIWCIIKWGHKCMLFKHFVTYIYTSFHWEELKSIRCWSIHCRCSLLILWLHLLMHRHW